MTSNSKPWDALGISRATYYRRTKGERPAKEKKAKAVPKAKSQKRETVKAAKPSKPLRERKIKAVSGSQELRETETKTPVTVETVLPKRDHLWKPGQSGNPAGRPKGTRVRLTANFVAAMSEDFEKHGKAVIEATRLAKPEAYLAAMVRLVPQQMEVGEAGAFTEMADDEVEMFIAIAKRQLEEFDGNGVVH